MGGWRRSFSRTLSDDDDDDTWHHQHFLDLCRFSLTPPTSSWEEKGSSYYRWRWRDLIFFLALRTLHTLPMSHISRSDRAAENLLLPSTQKGLPFLLLLLCCCCSDHAPMRIPWCGVAIMQSSLLRNQPRASLTHPCVRQKSVRAYSVMRRR